MNVFDRLDAGAPLDDDERMLVESVRAFARNELAPRADGFDRTAEFPWKNVEGINRLGLNQMFVPQDYGGSPLISRVSGRSARPVPPPESSGPRTSTR